MRGPSVPRGRSRTTTTRLVARAAELAAILVALTAIFGQAPFPLVYKVAAQVSQPGKLNLFDPSSRSQSASPRQQRSDTTPTSTTPAAPMCSNAPFPMQPGTVALNPATDAHFVSSDGALTIDVPAGAISPSQLATDGGSASLLARQVAPASGSSAGGWGLDMFGTYLIQVVTASGALATHGLSQPATITFAYGSAGALDMTHAFSLVNASIPTCVNVDPASIVLPAQVASLPRTKSRRSAGSALSDGQLRATLGRIAHPATSADLGAGTLGTSVNMNSPTTSLSFGTNAPVATFGKPAPFEVDLSGGSLLATYPIDLPPGPKGFKPPLSLVYNSAGVSDQHNPMGAAPWAGEGWNVTMGQISWSEVQTNAGGTPRWQDTWELSDPYGTSAELLPPATNVSTFYDDTGNQPYQNWIQWHTAPETYARIFSFVTNTTLPGGSAKVPCFRVFLKNGIMEEFGCTTNSLEWYPNPSGSNAGKPYIASWLLDLITEPDGNQVQITYRVDSRNGYNNQSYPRDEVVSNIMWDSPSCTNAQTACTGNSWQPLMNVYFDASPLAARGSVCANRGDDRCDDPKSDQQISTPTIESTFVLNDLYVQVRPVGGANFNTLTHYQFTYDQTAPGVITDPVTDMSESTAGRLLLTQISITGADGTTTLPNLNFGYGLETETYLDSLQNPASGAGCGWPWNVPCKLWNQSYAGNSYYLVQVYNGLGLSQTFAWAKAHNNTHTVSANPFGCNDSGGNPTNTYPCDEADDRTWSRIVLSTRTDAVLRSWSGHSNTEIDSTTSYAYNIVNNEPAFQCSDCKSGYSWGDQNENDYLDFYNGKFFGFNQVTVTKPDNSKDVHMYSSTEGWGLYDVTQVFCWEAPTNPCHNSAYWDASAYSNPYRNALHGLEYEVDRYSSQGIAPQYLLDKTVTQYQVTSNTACLPPGVGASTPIGGATWGGNRVSELDNGGNPAADCYTPASQVDHFVYDTSTASGVPDQTTTYVYDAGNSGCQCYGRMTQETVTGNDGGANGTPTTIVKTYQYSWNDNVNYLATPVTGTYLIDFTHFSDVEDTGQHQYQCTYNSYDGASNPAGQTSTLTAGDLTRTDRYTNCANLSSGQISSGFGYSIANPVAGVAGGNPVSTTDGVGMAPPLPPNNPHISSACVAAGTTGSTCTTFDATFQALPLVTTNALNRTTSTQYADPVLATAAAGFGLWPMSSTDANGQVTSYTYDGLERLTTVAMPGETGGQTTQTTRYTVWCATNSGPLIACAEVDKSQRINSTTTITSRAFYDGLGNLVETRSPAAGGNDVVQYSFYDQSERLYFKSIPYLVASYTGGPGSAAFSVPDSNQPGTTYAYDGLGRTISVTDARSGVTSTSYGVACNAPGTGDAACYEQVLTVDPLNHQSGSLTDAFGRVNYEQRYTGTGTQVNPYALYATTKYTYDYLGELTQIMHPDGVTKTSFQYDMAGRQTGLTDPDRGVESYAYDQDGNLTQSVDARGTNGTIYSGYDGVDRPIWRNTTNSPTNAFDTYTYDSTAGGNVGIGRLTGETFSGAGLSGSESYVYDVRGQPTSTILTVGVTPYSLSAMSYDDAGKLVSQTYPNGETVKNIYDSASDWLTGVTSTTGSTTTTLLSGAQYQNTPSTNFGGGYGQITAAGWNGTSPTYNFSSTFDALGRATDIKLTRVAGGATLFDQSRTFDAAGNVSTENSTLPAGTDNQAFCYDEQNRLTQAASSGTLSKCLNPFTPGTLSGAYYNQTFGYDNMGRLTGGLVDLTNCPGSNPAQPYCYSDSKHVHGVTQIGTTYTAAYDLAGNMTCRAASSSKTCNGTPTGALLAYNSQGQLSSWQNKPNTPTTTAAFLYDGQGMRVAQQVVSGTSTTTTAYVGSVEEVVSGSTNSTTTYYYANGSRLALAVGSALSYLASDGLGSANVTLDANGNATSKVLYAPYGSPRYSAGTMPTDHGFTGQIADATSGLDYYGARYYDPVAGQFASGDSVLPGGGYDAWGLSRFAYVEGNPIARNDPLGHCQSDSCYESVQSYNTSGCSSDSCYAMADDYQNNVADSADATKYRQEVAAEAAAMAKSAAVHKAAAQIHQWLNSNIFGPTIGKQDYFTIGAGYNTQWTLGITFSVTVTPDTIFFTDGAGFGNPGWSLYGNAGRILQKQQPTAAQIDQFVSGPSLVGGGAPGGIGGNVVWGNEGHMHLNDFGIEYLGGTKQIGAYQTNSVDLTDPNFASDFFGPLVPLNAT